MERGKDSPHFADLQVGDTVFIQYHPREKYRFWEFGKVNEIKGNNRSALAEISIERTNLQKSDLLGAHVDEVDVVQRANEPMSPMVKKFYSYIDLDFLNLKGNLYSNADKKLREIYLGLQHGIDVDPFVRPEYSADQMKELRLELEKELFVKAEGVSFELAVRAAAFRDPESFLNDSALGRCQSEQEAQGYESRAEELRKVISEAYSAPGNVRLSENEWLLIKAAAAENDASGNVSAIQDEIQDEWDHEL